MSLIIRHILIVVCLLICLAGQTEADEIYLDPRAAQDNTPAFSLFQCVIRGPYEGMAQAQIGYQYDGEFQVTPEDMRLMGDTQTGEAMILNYPIEPGRHENALTLNVGANKVVVLKIILFGDLYVLTAYDNPDVPDCAWATPEPTMEGVSDA